MGEARSVTVQSILFENEPGGIIRAAEAVANSARLARERGLLSSWALALGDCGTSPTLDESHLARIRHSVEAQGGTVVHVYFGENLGHGGGHNRLALKTRSDLLLFLNPDAVLGPDSLALLMVAVGDNVGVVDGRQLPLEHPKDYDSATGETSWASGACSLTQRHAFEAVDGFDHETFFLYCDDVDYSWRLKLAGYSVRHEPAARVFHDKRLTVDGDIVASPAEVYFSAEAGLFLAHKYSRPQIVTSILESFRKSSEKSLLDAAAEYDRRNFSGILPSPLDPHHRVSQFVNGNYAMHRY